MTASRNLPLHEKPVDSTIIIETLHNPERSHSGKRRTKNRLVLPFRVEAFKELRVHVKGKQVMLWKPERRPEA